jgi:hypothetical protein
MKGRINNLVALVQIELETATTAPAVLCSSAALAA